MCYLRALLSLEAGAGLSSLRSKSTEMSNLSLVENAGEYVAEFRKAIDVQITDEESAVEIIAEQRRKMAIVLRWHSSAEEMAKELESWI